jgi:N-methylhydantoinase B
MIGGSGGRLQGDGIDGCDFSQGALANTPVESIENEVPILVREYSVVPDSAGPGKFRGGLAFRLDFQVFHPDTIVTARGMERFRFQPWGLAGGRHGTSGDCRLDPDTPRERNLGKLNSLKLEAGNVLSVRTPGGGGYGDPWTRDVAAVLADVRDGVVSAQAARDDYGVVISGGQVDEGATRVLRAARPPAENAPDPGPGRTAHERVFSFEVAEAMAEMLYGLPPGVRYYAKTRLYERIRAIAARGEIVSAETVRALRPELLQAMGMGAGRGIAGQIGPSAPRPDRSELRAST